MKKRVFSTLIISLVAPLIFSFAVYAGNGRCGYKGCERSTVNCHNGTVFCDTHAAAYAREKGYKTCPVSGCYDQVTSGNTYCYRHTCSASGCYNKAGEGRLCSTHKCKYSGCTSMRYYTSGKYAGYCNNHAWKVSGKTSSYSKKTTYSSKNSSSSKKTYTMPDCDDYDSYDDFMDDWDGCMPDGSDAEDYWENW